MKPKLAKAFVLALALAVGAVGTAPLFAQGPVLDAATLTTVDIGGWAAVIGAAFAAILVAVLAVSLAYLVIRKGWALLRRTC